MQRVSGLRARELKRLGDLPNVLNSRMPRIFRHVQNSMRETQLYWNRQAATAFYQSHNFCKIFRWLHISFMMRYGLAMSIKEHNKYQTSKIVKEMSGVDHTSCDTFACRAVTQQWLPAR